MMCFQILGMKLKTEQEFQKEAFVSLSFGYLFTCAKRIMYIPSAPSSMTTGTKKERKNWFIALTYSTAAKEFF